MIYRRVNYNIRQMLVPSGFSWSIEFPDGKVIRGTAKSKQAAEETIKPRIDQWLRANKSQPTGGI
jgi:hypothetical protein